MRAEVQGPAAEPLAVPPAMPERALRIAEAAFLVQGANDRLLVTGDVHAALAMLLAAQSIIDQIDDAALTDVRAALNADVASLRDVTVVDIDATVRTVAGAAEVAAGFADARRPIRFDAGSRIRATRCRCRLRHWRGRNSCRCSRSIVRAERRGRR